MLYNQKKIFLFIIVLCVLFPKFSFADKAYFDISEDVINIQTDFKGKDVIIFGLTDPKYETILIVKGPSQNIRLSIKERLFGFWIDTKKFTFQNIPSIFFIASSSPVTDILDEKIIRQKGLNFNNFSLDNENIKDSKMFENNLYEWDRNLIRKQKENNMYKEYNLEIVDEKLFQARVFFPSITAPGNYDINIFQVKNKKIINESTKKIIIKKKGIGSKIYNFAQDHSSLYGILCIIFSVTTGILAAAAFRRL